MRAAALVLALAATPLAVAQAQESGNARRGLVYVRGHCSSCHAVERGNRHSPNRQAPAFTTIANVPGMTAIALHAALTTPHRVMPNILVEANDRDDVIAYILGLARN